MHKLNIKLFKYIEVKYFKNFQLSDEGQYWEMGDVKVADMNFNFYDDMLDEVSHAFENFLIKGDETIEASFERVLKWVQKK